jgi:hypothetical protein
MASFRDYRGQLAWTLGVASVTLLLGPSRNASPVGSPAPLEQSKAESTMPPSQPAASSQAALSENNPTRAVREFWSFAGTEDGKDFAEELSADPGRMDVDFLIAAVPDPIDTRFSYRFDSLLDDIQLALKSQNWLLDRLWFPWLPSGRQPARRDEVKGVIDPSFQPKSKTVTPAPGDKAPSAEQTINEVYEMSSKEGTSPPLHETRPGVMIFRRPREPYGRSDQALKDVSQQNQQVLIVFLIGDRPTSGLQSRALGYAFKVIDHSTRSAGPFRWRWEPPLATITLAFVFGGRVGWSAAPFQWEPPLAPVEFRILAPYFSGSERSLSLAINRWVRHPEPAKNPQPTSSRFGPRYRFVVRSGAANRIDRKKFLSDCQSGHLDSELKVDFTATVHHFDLLMRATFDYLKEQNGGRDLGKVALLTESDTEFGRQVPERDKINREWGVKTLTRMDFPFHISQLAAAYDATRAPDDKVAPILPRSSSKLRIPFDEIGSPNDTVPAMAPRMTAASEEFNLAKILETISMEDYRYVGIVATDTRDVIFLGGLIREFCPDVNLFTTTADLLLGHPDYSPHLRGMLVAAPYPVFSMAQRWDPPHEGDMRRHLFMHNSDQGYYNAALTLAVRGRSGVRLELHEPVDDLEQLPDEGRNRIIITSVCGKRHFRVFDDQKPFVDTDQKPYEDIDASALPGRGAQVDALWKYLEARKGSAVLTGAEKDGVVSAVSTILGRSLNTRYFDYLFDYGKPFDEMDELAWSRREDAKALRGEDVYKPTADDVCLPVWLSTVGTRGLWPLKFLARPDFALADGGFALHPTEEDRPDPTHRFEKGNPLRESDHWVAQFIPLIPQLSWAWGTLAALILFLAGGALWVHVQLAREPGHEIKDLPDWSWRHLYTLRPLSGPGMLPTLRFWQLAASLGILAVIGVVAYLHVADLCLLTVRHSSWSAFFPLPHYRRIAMLPWGDLWNWVFALILMWASCASLLALAAAAIVRIDLTLDAARADEAALKGKDDGPTVKWVVATLKPFEDLFRDRPGGSVSWAAILISVSAGLAWLDIFGPLALESSKPEEAFMIRVAVAQLVTLVVGFVVQVAVAWASLPKSTSPVEPPVPDRIAACRIGLALLGTGLVFGLLSSTVFTSNLVSVWPTESLLRWDVLSGYIVAISLVSGSALWERLSQQRRRSDQRHAEVRRVVLLFWVVAQISLAVGILLDWPDHLNRLWVQILVALIVPLGVWGTVRSVRLLRKACNSSMAGWYTLLATGRGSSSGGPQAAARSPQGSRETRRRPVARPGGPQAAARSPQGPANAVDAANPPAAAAATSDAVSQQQPESDQRPVELPTAVPLFWVVALIALAVGILLDPPYQLDRLWGHVLVGVLVALGVWGIVRSVRPLSKDPRSWMAGWYSLLAPKRPSYPETQQAIDGSLQQATTNPFERLFRNRLRGRVSRAAILVSLAAGVLWLETCAINGLIHLKAEESSVFQVAVAALVTLGVSFAAQVVVAWTSIHADPPTFKESFRKVNVVLPRVGLAVAGVGLALVLLGMSVMATIRGRYWLTDGLGRWDLLSACVVALSLVLGAAIRERLSQKKLSQHSLGLPVAIPMGWVVALIALAAGVLFDPPDQLDRLWVHVLVAVVVALGVWGIVRLPEKSPSSWKAVPCVAAVLIVGFELLLGEPRPPYDRLLYLERAVSLANGVSPLVPCLLLATAFVAWLLSQLRRMDYVHSLWSDRIHEGWETVYILKSDTRVSQTISDILRERKKRLTDASLGVLKLLTPALPLGIGTHPVCLIGLGLTVIMGLRLLERYVPTLDGIGYNRAAVLTFAVLEFMIALSLCRLLVTWAQLRRLLREVDLLPMQDAFTRVPVVLSREFGPYLNAGRPTLKNLEISVRQWAHVASQWEDKLIMEALKIGCDVDPNDTAGNDFKTELADLRARILKYSESCDPKKVNAARGVAISEKYEKECLDPAKVLQPARSEIRKDLRQAAIACLSIAIPYWNTKTVDEGYGQGTENGARRHGGGGGDQAAGGGEEVARDRCPLRLVRGDDQSDKVRLRRWVEAAEGLYALEIVNFASECTVQLKNLAQFLTAGPLLLLLAATSYPFQPQRFLVVTICSLLVASSVGLLWTYIQMERNEVLSRVSKTPPNKVTWSWTFFGQLMTVIVPLLGAALTQFPSLSDTINGWIEPILRVVK